MDRKQESVDKKWYYISLVLAVPVFFVTGYLAIHFVGDLIGNFQNSTSYAVIMDAGSSSTKLHVFTFRGADSLELNGELFAKAVPGISQYAETPEALKEPLEDLLEKARAQIPESKWSETPVLLKATAGLRLLKNHLAQGLLQETRKIFAKSKFAQVNGSVALMAEADEGIYSWVTINYLLGKFKRGGDWENTVALDLGGASTQVTFARSKSSLESRKMIEPEHAKNFYNFSIFGRDMEIYSRSVLGLGIDAARRFILCHPNQCDKDDRFAEVFTDCLGSSENVEWSYAHKQYVIKGNPKRSEESFMKCLETVKTVVSKNIEGKLPPLTDKDIYAISFYDNLATQVGLTTEKVHPKFGIFFGNYFKVRSLYNAAQENCLHPRQDKPFWCLELTYIYGLLRYGFALDEETRLTTFAEINGYRVSWALGVALHDVIKHVKV